MRIIAYLTIPSSHTLALDSEEDQTKERERERMATFRSGRCIDTGNVLNREH